MEGEGQQGKGTERRRSPRLVAELAVKVRVLVEEQTFSPFVFDGTCDNISRSGALTTVRDLAKQTYLTLIKRNRYIRLTCDLPNREKPVVLFGKLVWYDYKEEGQGSICKLAMTFEPLNDETQRALDEYLDTLPFASDVKQA